MYRSVGGIRLLYPYGKNHQVMTLQTRGLLVSLHSLLEFLRRI
ncbi:unnamed protein product [Haemonchus placei]|uniref:Uncharacterized protein n=1 Tax=Haemonchus placei TaxID=6290 RepID=A0A0N4WDY2_HAEPC|nr:unnamed protein product [Haemonchus placei]